LLALAAPVKTAAAVPDGANTLALTELACVGVADVATGATVELSTGAGTGAAEVATGATAELSTGAGAGDVSTGATLVGTGALVLITIVETSHDGQGLVTRVVVRSVSVGEGAGTTGAGVVATGATLVTGATETGTGTIGAGLLDSGTGAAEVGGVAVIGQVVTVV